MIRSILIATALSAALATSAIARPVTPISSATTISATDCGSDIVASGSSQYSVTLGSASAIADGCDVTLKNSDTRGKTLAGFPADVNTRLYPTQEISVTTLSGAWVAMKKPGRWRTSNLTLCVDVNGNDVNDGLAGSGSGCLRHINFAGSILQTDVDFVQSTPIIAAACNQTFNEQFGLGAQPLGGNLIQLSPNGNCGFSMANSGSCISIGDNAMLDIRANQYGSSGSIDFSGCNSSNTAQTGVVYCHNYCVVDIEGSVSWAPSGVNANFLFIDGAGIATIADGITQKGGAGGNYAIYMNAGGKVTLSGPMTATQAGGLVGLYWVSGRSMLILGTSGGTGWSSLGTSKVSGWSLIVFGGSIPGGVSASATGKVCTSMTTC